MDDQQLEEKMKKLRTTMENMPDRTDKGAIMREISRPSKKRPSSKLLIVAASIASLIIFSLLMVTSFGNIDLFHSADSIPGKNDQALELLDAQVEIHSDEDRVGGVGVGINKGEDESEYIVPTALTYEFVLKNSWNKTLGSLKEYDEMQMTYTNGLQIQIEPRDQLEGVLDDVFGVNIFREGSPGLGKGYSVTPVLEPEESRSFMLDFTLGASIENFEVPSLPSQKKLDELFENAANADLVVMLQDEEIARFDLSKYIEGNQIHENTRTTITYTADNMDRGNHDYMSNDPGEIFMDPTYYEKNEMQRGDVVYFPTPAFTSDENTDLSPPERSISRVVGLPGERLEIKDGYVFINGEKLARLYNKALVRGMEEERYFKVMEHNGEEFNRSEMEAYFNQDMDPVKIPENHVFVLGDQWWRSIDSRMFGPLPMDDIEGKVLGK